MITCNFFKNDLSANSRDGGIQRTIYGAVKIRKNWSSTGDSAGVVYIPEGGCSSKTNRPIENATRIAEARGLEPRD